MFKRTKGYFLLTMLVLTGLAGRLRSDTLSAKERHNLVTELKTSRTDLLKATEGLSNKQFLFRPGKGRLSIKDCVFQLVSIETDLWTHATGSLKQEPQSLEKIILNDEELAPVVQQQGLACCKTLKFKNSKDALNFYKGQRAEMLRYVQTSTENVRAHIAKTELGNFDVYQLVLLNTMYSRYYAHQIEQIKSGPRFPK